MTGPGQSDRATRLARRALPLLAAALLAALPATALAKNGGKDRHSIHHSSDDAHAGAVYTITNDPSGNAVVVFTRNSVGTLTPSQTVSTGGNGSASQPPFGFTFVDTQGAINMAHGGHLLFVVNDGSNTVSSFRVTDSGLTLVDQVWSGGTLPVSVTSSNNVLYVVNEISSNIYGYRISDGGHLTPLEGQAPGGQPLSTPFPTTVAAQIGFAPGGRQLVVTERGLPAKSGVIDTFAVNGDGLAGPAQKHTGVGLVDANPFGFSFGHGGQLLVSNVGFVDVTPVAPPIPQVFDPTQFNGSASSFDLSHSGGLTLDGAAVPSGGRAACWLVVSNGGNYAFVTNTLSDTVADLFSGKGAVTSYAVGGDGTLTKVGQGDTSSGPGPTPIPSGPTDEAVSPDSHFLYVLDPNPFGPGGHIDEYRIGSGGSLTHIGATDSNLAAGVSGLAAN